MSSKKKPLRKHKLSDQAYKVCVDTMRVCLESDDLKLIEQGNALKEILSNSVQGLPELYTDITGGFEDCKTLEDLDSYIQTLYDEGAVRTDKMRFDINKIEIQLS